jgi:hypothetical protein
MPGYGKSAPHFTKARPKPRVKPPKQHKHKKRRR